MCKFEV
ncbi:uncharacterized protein DMAD_08946 [Drosophila madeirensis]